MEHIKESLKRWKEIAIFAKPTQTDIDRFDACFNQRKVFKSDWNVKVVQIPIKKKTTQGGTKKMWNDFIYYK